MKGEGIAAVLRFAEKRAGLAFSPGQAELAAAAVRRAMQRAGVRAPEAFLRLADSDAVTCDLLLEELSVGETYFFREPDQLAFLRRHVLPEFAARGPGAEVRAWSAACATGEEAYTLAMLLGEAGCPRVHVLGTDVVRSRLAAAERASYRPWSLRGVSQAAARRWFQREDDRFRVRPEVRALAAFRPLNLAEPRRAYVAAGAWGMDLVFCRNVLIYLDPATIRHVAARLLDALAPDGWLFLGASDPPLAELVPCDVVQTGAGLAYRRPGRGGAAPAPFEPSAPVQAPAPCPSPRSVPAAAPAAALALTPGAPAAGAALPAGADGWAARVRALADRGDLAEADAACAAGLELHRESPELLVLRSTLHFAARRFADAAAAARRALYLDRGCAAAHLALGSALVATGDTASAARAFRTAAGLLRALPPREEVPGSGGERAARLLAVAESQLRVLEGAA